MRLKVLFCSQEWKSTLGVSLALSHVILPISRFKRVYVTLRMYVLQASHFYLT